jgi:uncharacterized membrane protein
MDASYLLDWLNLLARWAHLIVGIAWIGSSFYFVWLDNSLEPPKTGNPRHLGELWSVHGGGFYNNVKFKGAPETMPEHLHWFYWESYSTWLTGFFLMCVLYYAGADTYLIDRSIADLTKWQAIGAGLAFLAGGWIVYDLLCRALHHSGRALGAAVIAYCVVAAWALTHLFSGRGAFVHFGAMLATIMSANVFFVIIPGQRKTVAAMKAGTSIDPAWGGNAKHRSVHNTYFTLPVLFCMISNHYAMTYSGRHAWLSLLAIAAAGVIIRLFFVLKHKSPPKWWLLVLGVAILAAVAVALRPAPLAVAPGAKADFGEVRRIVAQRCTVCHAAQPSFQGFNAPPKGYQFDGDDRIVAQAQVIHQQSVVTRVMPIANITEMTDAERAVIDAWFRAGARR